MAPSTGFLLPQEKPTSEMERGEGGSEGRIDVEDEELDVIGAHFDVNSPICTGRSSATVGVHLRVRL